MKEELNQKIVLRNYQSIEVFGTTTSAAAPTPPRFRKSRLEIFSICS